MAHLYFCEDTPSAEFRPGETVWVSGDEARHALRVSRLRSGELTMLGDGRGTIAHGEVIAADRDRFAVRIESATTHTAPAVRLVLAQALAKGDRDERAVEQATEFGVSEILPWEAERSVSRWSGAPEKQTKGREKWQRIAREASKQSLRAYIPEVAQLHRTANLAALAGEARTRVLVLHPGASQALSEIRLPDGSPDSPHKIVLVVGPEGGLSDAEIEALSVAGAELVRLGDTVLRTSSAGPAALAVLNTTLEQW